ncbi:MAG TPA: aldehyde dehydrogenase family protein [Gemmatimonadales bacterium]|jgi:aldehyde dehydrogenase (NAD+)|nr:aldehyde dehydrogenase family protein [Gemmatimonadales bacterium]
MIATVLQNHVGGSLRQGSGDLSITDHNPSDRDDVIGRVPAGSPDDARHAVEAAQSALASWRALPGPARAEHLYRWAALIEQERETLAQAVAREVGKPIGESRGEVSRCAVILRYYAGDAVRAVGEVVPAQAAGALQFTLRDPLGVCALITPWNFPVAIPLWKAAPALAFGNTVVLKPAEQASHVAILLAESAAKAGLPAGVFNVVLGSGTTVGSALLEADQVRAVSFTGSTGVGAQVAARCAARNIRYQTEMGGKNVAIVLADGDLDLAARLTAAGAMRYAGQKCTATSRVIVESRVFEPFMQRLRQEVEQLPLGPVTDAASAVGPLITAEARDRVRAAIAAMEGQVLVGGDAPADAPLVRGNFLKPAVVTDVSPDSAMAQDELFGPVLAAFTAANLDEAIGLANHTRYGLSASLFTRDIGAALEYIRRIEVGLVRVNGDTTGVDPHAPFGGVKASSSGSREQGSAAREFYTEIRTVQVAG